MFCRFAPYQADDGREVLEGTGDRVLRVAPLTFMEPVLARRPAGMFALAT